MNKKSILVSLALLFTTTSLLVGCDKNNSSGVENYYVINTSDIRSEMLVNHEMILEPSFTNLGEHASPKYQVEIKLDNEDVTSNVYNETTRTFAPKKVGSYKVTFTILDTNGEVYKTKDGSSFSKTVIIDVVVQSFVAINSDGKDVSISEDGEITFGSSYSKGGANKVDSGQYKVTGVTFEGSYSITYDLKNVKYDSVYSDPALYFGWVKDLNENNDDSIKLSSRNGTIATWVWGTNGDAADLSINKNHGWFKNVWWNAPGSVTNGNYIEGDHSITFERFVNEEKNTAIYGIVFDGVPFTYLNVGDAYTDLLRNVWVESVNTACTIAVKEYKQIDDNLAPTISLDYDRDYYVGDTINLNSGVKVDDNSIYKSILTPTYKVYDSKGEEVATEGSSFTPLEEGTYKIEASVNDLKMNEAKEETIIVVKEVDNDKTIIDVSDTSSIAMPNSGIVLYYSARKDNQDVELSSIKAYKDNIEVTGTTIFEYNSESNSAMKYKYFKAPIGNYTLEFTSSDGVVKTKDISVSKSNTVVYDFEYFDTNTLVYEDKFIVGKNTIIYLNNNNSGQTVKLAPKISKIYNWTISFDITDLSYSAQGKLFITKSTLNVEGNFIAWEDLAVGGSVKDGNQDLWGYEASVHGTGWVTYQWRSNWQEKTDEFMPDPSDPSKGCGRGADEYSQYAIGTHSYKISCEMDDNGKVTYLYYIDNELEVVHHTSSSHDYANGLDFIQFSSDNMNGIVSNICVQ